jgi:hypothetical protein
LETKILLGDVKGWIDHIAIDLIRNWLFVAELGSGSVGIVDLAVGKVIHRTAELNEPQDVGYEPTTDVLYVAFDVLAHLERISARPQYQRCICQRPQGG